MNISTRYAIIASMVIIGGITIIPIVAELPPACPDCEMTDTRTQAMKAASSEVPIMVWTDRSQYDHKSTIMVDGKVSNIKPGVPVTIKVTSPLNNIVTIQQVTVNEDGTFSTSFNTAGTLWKYDGTYIIRVQYGSQEVNNRVLVDLSGGINKTPAKSATVCENEELKTVKGFCVPFSIKGGKIVKAEFNTSEKSLTIFLTNTINGGTINVKPTMQQMKGIFFVLVDGEEWDDAIINGNEVEITFPPGAEKIEIFGTFVIPEFGTIAAMILAVAIVSIIAISARSRLSIMPKY